MPSAGLSRKRLATRRAISDVATRLFYERGFDQVTVDEIAAAADVGRMTVFTYFPRKEDMFFDLDEYGRVDLVMALRQRKPDTPPIETLRQFAHGVVEEKMPYVRFSPGSQLFFVTIKASEALKARARAIRDEVTALLAVALAESVGRSADDLDAYLASNFVVTTWCVAFIKAHEAYQGSQNAEEAQAIFLKLIDRGAVGLNALLAGTPYA